MLSDAVFQGRFVSGCPFLLQTLALFDQVVSGALQMTGNVRKLVLAVAAQAGLVLTLIVKVTLVVEDT